MREFLSLSGKYDFEVEYSETVGLEQVKTTIRK